jgi:hypothetical protein
LIGLAACGDGVDVSTNANNVCSEVAQVACHNAYQCCSEGEIEDFLNVSDPRTEPQCLEDLTRICERNIARLDAAIEAKRVKFESDTMNKCLEALVAPSDSCATVDTMLPWTEECMDSAWVGLVADGGQCFSNIECASKNSVCAPNQTCMPLPVAGQPCPQLKCAPGNFCQISTGTPTCQVQLGAGQMCSSSAQCLKPLFCDFQAAMPTCTDRLEGGAKCTSDQNCKSNECIPGTCAGTTLSCFSDTGCSKRCADDGSSCSTDAICSNNSGQCSVSGNFCSPSTVCAGVGETCNYPIKCLPGVCEGTPACTTAQVVADYCEGALGVIGGITN